MDERERYENGMAVRRAVLSDQGGDAIHHVTELLCRRDRLELALGQLQGQVEVTPVTDVNYRRRRTIDNLRRICQHDAHHAAAVARVLDVVVAAPVRAASDVARENQLT